MDTFFMQDRPEIVIKKVQIGQQVTQQATRFFNLANFLIASQTTGPIKFQVRKKVSSSSAYEYIKIYKPAEQPFSYQTMDTLEEPEEGDIPPQFSLDFDYLSTVDIQLFFNDAITYPAQLRERGWIIFDSANVQENFKQKNMTNVTLLQYGDLIFHSIVILPSKLPPTVTIGQYAVPINFFLLNMSSYFKRDNQIQIFFDYQAQWSVDSLRSAQNQQEILEEKQQIVQPEEIK